VTRLRAFLLDRGGLLAVIVLALYVWLARPYIVDGDNAELATLGALGGAAHPSGYPLYVLWLRAMAWLPGATPAHTAAIATAILGAAAILVLHAACRAWGARPLAATCACAIVAGAPVVLAMSSQAEVFALNDLAVAAVLWLAARGGPARGARRALLLGLVAGLGLSNHLTCALVAPVGLYGVVLGVREASWRALPAAALGLAVGLLPYAYLLVAPDTPISWGTVRSAGELVHMVTRQDYGGSGAFLAHGKAVPPGANLVALLDTLGRAWLWLPALIGLATLAWRCARRRDGESRIAWCALAASWLAAGPWLASRFNTVPEDMGLYIVHRFHLLPTILLAVPVAVGLDALARRLPARAARLATPAQAVVATLGLAAVASLSLPHVLRVHTAAVERYVRNTLAMLPPRAVVVAGTDEIYFGGTYVQQALGERRDVTLVAWPQMALLWYRERVARRDVLAVPGDQPASVRMAQYVLSTGAPLFVDKHQPDILAAFPSYPYGTLVRVLPRGTPAPPIEQVVAENREVFSHFVLDYPRPGEHDEWPTVIHERYARSWATLSEALAAAGHTSDAADALELARELGPAP